MTRRVAASVGSRPAAPSAGDWLALGLDAARLLEWQGLSPDPWQRDFLQARGQYLLLCCARGAGKSRVTSVLALHQALFQPGSQVLLLSRSLRQAQELYRYVQQGLAALSWPLVRRRSASRLELDNGSRILALPSREETSRGFQGVHLLVLDEAARIPDVLYQAVSPMTGTVRGRTVLLSTPFGQRGFFWRAWEDQAGPWQRFCVPWQACPRLSAEFIAQERRRFGPAWVAQEYECCFTSCSGLVYPQFAVQVSGSGQPPATGRRVGGIDFGFRNPFAAVWGRLDAQDVLWLEGERYQRGVPLHVHAAALPRGVLWYADPSGATEIQELRAAGHRVLPASNEVCAGLQAVTARLQTGRLRVCAGACPQLLAEARTYCYPEESEKGSPGERPRAGNNHALDALRYLISGLDARFLARCRPPASSPLAEQTHARTTPSSWLRWDNEALWQECRI
jgi:hypothetical protein